MKEITLQVPDGKKAEWREVNGITIPVLVDDVVEDNRPITERVKTFEDACNVLGKDHPLVFQYEQTEAAFRGDNMNEDLVAYLKLRIITAALNEGWAPEFTEDEYRYFPYFCFYTQQEIEEMSDEQKKELGLWGAAAFYGAYAGLGSVHSIYAWSCTYASYGSRLAYKTSDLAKYSGKQFISIWADYVGPFNIKEVEK